jgi:hypothetical protein
MRRSAEFMTRSGTLCSRAMNRARQLVTPPNGPYIKRDRRGQQNHGANRAKNREVREQ